eukprot:CAMPEP_0172329010 /NCGR_PEP_ID=MMETSP1058-20130122/60654_1 /TAXON_ID=83371 /ORGANISM="Detonula confervacea, Strain CCMP 353" /LENGTH=794 /DNA_ID=CAMNT_0013046155 /DNA_START=85 /DNA_END=2470 /DNA_ORIENTATION=+
MNSSPSPNNGLGDCGTTAPNTNSPPPTPKGGDDDTPPPPTNPHIGDVGVVDPNFHTPTPTDTPDQIVADATHLASVSQSATSNFSIDESPMDFPGVLFAEGSADTATILHRVRRRAFPAAAGASLSDYLHDMSLTKEELLEEGGYPSVSGQRYSYPILHSKKLKQSVLGVIALFVICLVVAISLSNSEKGEINLPDAATGGGIKKSPSQAPQQVVVIKKQGNPATLESTQTIEPNSSSYTALINESPSIQYQQTDDFYRSQDTNVVMFQSSSEVSFQIVEGSNNMETAEPESTETIEPNNSYHTSLAKESPSIQYQQTDDFYRSQDQNVVTYQSSSEVSVEIVEGSNNMETAETIHENDDPITTKYAPKWFDRSQGWMGLRYIDGIAFCASQDSYIPCPYEAICPNGMDSAPTGGNRNDTEAWAPIIDVPNGWVNVGSSSEVSSCTDYNSVHANPPLWGVSTNHGSTPDDVDHAPHVMCCRAPPPGDINSFDHIQGSQDPDFQLSEISGIATTEISSNTVSTPTDIDRNEQDVLDKLHPVWFGRKHGYHGTTYEEAADFCKLVGDMHLCPREAYCPEGPKTKPLFLQRQAFEGEQWAPMFDTPVNRELSTDKKENSWVLVGTINGFSWSTCMTYDQINPEDHGPQWGMDGTQQELKENILCCLNPNNFLQEQQFARQLDTLWLDESHGWSGGSHDDAMEFCGTIGRRKLCPHTAYCPHGPSQPVIGGHTADFNSGGEQWAPLYGDTNRWVMIGQKYENSATTCMDSYSLEGGEPYWGLSGERKEVKNHIMCCSF